MNITRMYLKTNAKDVLRTKYWPFFFISLLQVVFSGYMGLRINVDDIRHIQNIPAFFSLIGAGSVLSILITIFLVNPFSVGYKKFLIHNSENEITSYSMLWDVFKTNYIETVKNTFMVSLMLFLWSLPMLVGSAVMLGAATVFYWNSLTASVIAIIVYAAGFLIFLGGAILSLFKRYSYYMTDYIYAENPDMTWQELISESKRMMFGYGFFTFVTELSFIGWYLLGAILCGIGALFVNPYKDATMTQLYLELRGPKNYGYTIID